jgi:hypothetical protein
MRVVHVQSKSPRNQPLQYSRFEVLSYLCLFAFATHARTYPPRPKPTPDHRRTSAAPSKAGKSPHIEQCSQPAGYVAHQHELSFSPISSVQSPDAGRFCFHVGQICFHDAVFYLVDVFSTGYSLPAIYLSGGYTPYIYDSEPYNHIQLYDLYRLNMAHPILCHFISFYI